LRVDIQTNTTPIRAGDEVMIDFHPNWTDLGTFYYSVHLSFDAGRSFTRTLASNVSIFTARFPWAVDAIGFGLVIRVTAHAAFGLVARHAFSPMFTVSPSPPLITSPARDERVASGAPYTVRWDQSAPDPATHRIFFSSDGGQTRQLLRQDIPGSARSSTVTIPGPATDDGVIRVQGVFPNFPPTFDEVRVRVSPTPVVKVTSPNGRVTWVVGEAETISWTAGGQISSFRVKLSRNNGLTWTTLFSNIDPTLRHTTYSVDPPVSEACKIRVEAHGPAGEGSDTSDSSFHIRATRPRD
jgi:hypothetical protein